MTTKYVDTSKLQSEGMRVIRRRFLALFAGLSASVVACSTAPAASPTTAPAATAAPNPTTAPAAASSPTGAAPAATVAAAPTTAAVPTTQPTPSTQTVSTPGATAAASADSGSLIVLEPDPSSTQASFTVREQLANKPLPSDAIGTTNAVTGKITVHPDGTFVTDQSKISVDLTSLKTDQPKRDNFIKNNTLHVNQYPTATFVPSEAKGLPSPIPASGPLKFQLTGDMTVHGVTKPVTWDVTSTINGKDIKGTATTNLKFEDFGMTPPKVAVVLSVVDNIKLDLNFHFTPVAGA